MIARRTNEEDEKGRARNEAVKAETLAQEEEGPGHGEDTGMQRAQPKEETAEPVVATTAEDDAQCDEEKEK